MVARPTRPVIPYLYKYSNANHLARLESLFLRHELYFPKPSQLNDPADGRPKLAKASLDKTVAFLYESFLAKNPGLLREAYKVV